MKFIKQGLLLPLSLFLLSLTSGCDQPLFDLSNSSYVYLHNNTSQSIELSFQSNLADSYWQAETTSIAPYHRAKILSIRRNNGFSNEDVYTLSTEASLEDGSNVTLLQILRGSSLNETLDYSAYNDNFNSGSIDDKNIHRFTLSNSPLLALATKAQNKAIFKDIHYAINEANDLITANPDATALNILSYNIWGLPLIASDIEARFNEIPAHVKNYDVLALQEAFDPERQSLFLDLEAEYPYRTAMLDGPEDRLYDGGVIIFSRYPIVNEGQFIYPDCSGADCFADKGINYAEIIKGGSSYHVFATHTASFDTDTARNHRLIQFGQMKDFATSFAISNSEMVIYAGDLNVNKLRFADDYANMLSILNASEPSFTGYTTATFDPDINLYAQDPQSGADHKQYLDYLLISNDYAGFNSNENRVFVPRSNANDLFEYWDLSDHFPVHGSIQ